MLKKLIHVLMIAVMPLGIAAAAFSAQDTDVPRTEESVQQVQAENEQPYTITRIEGSMIVVQKAKNEEFTIHIDELESLHKFKVGDKVFLKNGKITN